MTHQDSDRPRFILEYRETPPSRVSLQLLRDRSTEERIAFSAISDPPLFPTIGLPYDSRFAGFSRRMPNSNDREAPCNPC